ncbi:hypothetical protein TUM18999_09300 [Pseudomonas tohonis]|uniref:Uncharacterized protein n=1 Tax=Pseudomonas tohonis TaxID=2725477 RepID=A0A6J4E045_9PSED|nr:hypothetical protein TUM18999_09300 [Pseudomonas tohonis]GJN55829.1 hypothetical protein TUM20286_55810 [Pseudomonas tohonis]
MSTQELASDPTWVQICQAAALDPQRRFASRQAVLASTVALEATLYRGDEDDPDAEEEDLGDARVLITGTFQPPAEWSAEERADYYDGSDPEEFFSALIECIAAPASRAYFTAEAGDQVAVSTAEGAIQMYYLYEIFEDEDGHHAVLIRDTEAFI